MTSQGELFSTTREIKDFQSCVVPTCDKLGVGGSKSNATNGFVVCLNLLDIVKVWLPVFDDTVLVSGD